MRVRSVRTSNLSFYSDLETVYLFRRRTCEYFFSIKNMGALSCVIAENRETLRRVNLYNPAQKEGGLG